MKKIVFIGILMAFMGLQSCESSKPMTEKENTTQSTTNSAESSSLVQPSEPLLGKWQLEYMNPILGKDINHYKIQKPYLNFVDKEKVAGNNGCNNIAGSYESDDRKIHFPTQKFGATRMFCEGVDEAAFLKGLAKTTHYAVMDDGQKLVLNGDDIVMLSFKKIVEKQELPTQ